MTHLLLVLALACGGSSTSPAPTQEPIEADSPDLHGVAANGADTPAFTVKAMSGEDRTVDNLKGQPTVIWFYPRAGTPGCTIEGCGYRDQHDAFETFHVNIVGVSFDTPEANAAWAVDQKFPFELWSDADRTLAMHFGAATSKDASSAKRITVLLDAEGKWVRTYTGVNDDIGAHPLRVLEDVRQLFADSPAP